METHYFQPLNTILPGNVFPDIFSNIQLITNWHATFLQSLETLLECGDTFAETLVEMLPVLRQFYTQYNENYDHAMETLENAKKLKAFAAFLEKKQKDIAENKVKDLLSYLHLPIQRMIAYDSLIKDIVSLTRQDHDDYQALTNAYNGLREIQEHANQRSLQRKNINRVVEIQNSLIGGDTQLALPHRRYVSEGDVFLGKEKKDRHLFLFNDLLVCVKLKKSDQKKAKLYQIDFAEPLETLKVETVADTRGQFRLYSSSREYYIISDNTNHWVQLITDTIKQLKGEGPKAISAHNKIEESSRESLMNRIIAWSKMDNRDLVISQIKELAVILEKYKTVNT